MPRLRRSQLIAATLLSAALTIGPAGNAPAGTDCVPWSAAGPIIAKNGLKPADVVYGQVQARAGGEIIHAGLCKDGGRYFYKFVVLGKTGDVQKITVDAVTGR